ncbi:hypothetical protein SUGI_0244460 [Cryptomeria japonica]|nr:hypothetical protein SUGI_0244460 [Cryptomeria japonica]
MIYYPIGHWWEILPEILEEFELDYTEYHQCVFVRSKHQLVVVGLFNRRTDIEVVLIFDFLSRKWRLGADMPRNRFEFACAASPTEGLVYIGGGYNGPYTEERSPYQLEAFVYNVEENKWNSLPPMNSDPLLDLCAGVFLDGKFYVVLHQQSESAQVYDPHTRLWRNINGEPNAHYVNSCVDALQDMMFYLQEFGRILMI